MRLLNRQSYERCKEDLLQRRRERRLENLEETRAKFRIYAANWRNKHRDKANLKSKARRLLLDGSHIGIEDLKEIIVRDKGICQLCHRKVAKREQSFDHIIPLSCGGHHTKTNLQLVHLFCNKSKNNGRIPSQTRLPLGSLAPSPELQNPLP